MGFEKFFINSKGWLTGSIRAQLTPAERSVWADLLALANESRFRGIICRAKGIPYQREFLATLLEIPIELLNSTIDKCIKDENADDPNTRIMIDEDGCIIITNWDKYQTSEAEWDKKHEELKEIKRISAEKSRANKSTIESSLQATTRAINKINSTAKDLEKKVKYIPTSNPNEVVDTETGETLQVVKINKEGAKNG
jgi:hypothetical protein